MGLFWSCFLISFQSSMILLWFFRDSLASVWLYAKMQLNSYNITNKRWNSQRLYLARFLKILSSRAVSDPDRILAFSTWIGFRCHLSELLWAATDSWTLLQENSGVSFTGLLLDYGKSLEFGQMFPESYTIIRGIFERIFALFYSVYVYDWRFRFFLCFLPLPFFLFFSSSSSLSSSFYPPLSLITVVCSCFCVSRRLGRRLELWVAFFELLQWTLIDSSNWKNPRT